VNGQKQAALWVMGTVGVLVAWGGVGAEPSGPTRRVLPADGRIVITEYGVRDWPKALVQYTVPGAKLKPGSVCLLGADGQAVPAQVDGETLAFVAALAKGATATFALGNGQPAQTSLRVTTGADRVEVANEFFALRLAPLGRREFQAADWPTKVPGPLTAWQPQGGPWLGATRFVATRRVVSLETKIVRNGPACFEYEARYAFEPKGEYVCRVTVCPGIEYAAVAEEYDFGAHTEGKDFLLVELHRGVTPATFAWVAGEGNEQFSRQPYAAFVETQTKANANQPAPVGGQGETPRPPQPEAKMVLLDKILPAGRWGGTKGGVEISCPATAGAAEARVAVTPMHCGSWRRALALTTWYEPDAGVVVALPVSTRQCRWYAEVTDDISPFSSHEHDPGLPAGYGRREWALYFGSVANKLQAAAGYIGLDRYKDWILDWPDTAKPTDYPRAWYTKAQVERLKKAMPKHPDRELLAKYYVFSGNPADAKTHAQQATQGLLGQHGYLGNWSVAGLSHYRQSQALAPVAALADDALACPELAADLRRDLRRALAVTAYLISDPDLNPRGAGVHLGNNNMPINRTCVLPMVAGLLLDHPLYRYWMDQSAAFLQFKVGSYFTPDGTALEPPMYQLYGPLRFLADAATVVHNTGGPDVFPPMLANGHYLANLSVPDARFDGRRILPGMGNSGNFLDSLFGFLVADAERLDPNLASRLQTVYRRAWPTEPLGTRWGNHEGMAFRYLPEVPESREPLSTTVLPTYGVVFRAHYDHPDETALLLRIGSNWGHWDPDPLNVILYGKGAPLSPGTGYQYYGGPASDNNAIYHNQVKIGQYDQPEIFGRVDDELRDYGLGPDADYAVASRYYPPEAFAEHGGELWWNRHVLFLKSREPAGANYFVMRDTFRSAKPRPSWWTWLNLEGADKISVDGQAFKKEDCPLNQKLAPEKMAAKDGQVVEMQTDFGASTWFWFDGKRTFRARLTFDYDVSNSSRLGMPKEVFPKLPGRETKTIMECVGAPGQDYFYVVFPRKSGEPVPTVAKLGDGVLKLTTAESTDYIFVSDTPLDFSQEGVTFAGKAGAVRVFKDRVALCLNSGVGKVGYQGCVFAGPGPFAKAVPLAELKAGETKGADTYEKKWQTLDLGEDLTVRGEAPFTAKLDGQTIRIETDGRTRQLFVTKPPWTRWLQYKLDGVPRMPCWTDYPASGWGRYKGTWLIALTVPDGKHQLEVEDLVYPAVWTRPFLPALGAGNR